MSHRPHVLALACVLLMTGLAAAEFRSDWPTGIERTWIGPEYWANRLQDWRVRDGRLECVAGAERFPLRTAHLLTRRVGAEPGTLEMTVRTGTDGDRVGWAGFLIGAGGAETDYRTAALVHHRPAEDGGLLAVADDHGMVSFRDNSRPAAAGNLWSIGGPLRQGEAPVLEPGTRQQPGGALGGEGIELRLTAEPTAAGQRLTLRGTDVANGRRVSVAVIHVPAGRLAGGLALVSQHRHWFRDWRISGSAVQTHDDRVFGPVLCVQYTLGVAGLRLTAQLGPLGDDDPREVTLELGEPDGTWRVAARAARDEDSHTVRFGIDGYAPQRDVRYRVRCDLATGGGRSRTHDYEGTIRRPPEDRDEFVIASLNCHKVYTGGLKWNRHGIWFPHRELTAAVRAHRPDLLFFAGDQIYEGDLDPVQRSPEDTALLDYLNRWYRWCWAFGELTRDTPTVTIPDDHDVYHGNLWGAGGRRAQKTETMSAQDSGGYRMSPRFVNAVHRTQTSHLPDPYRREPIGAGYSTYYTTMEYAGVSFAILADRQYKSSPTVAVPDGDCVNGWFRDPGFDAARDADVPGAELLGAEQLAMLRAWATDRSRDAWMKVVLSQSPFVNVATLPEKAVSGSVIPSLPILPEDVYPGEFRLVADADSNGWPQTGRDNAVRAMRDAMAIHLAGDQHLGSLVQYGVDDWRDASFAFCAPAIANTWPRRWWPPQPGARRDPGAPAYTGDFVDGFGNSMTVWAVANPVVSGREPARLYDRAPGYGIVRLDRSTRRITFECWPRWVDPTAADAQQYRGWPKTIEQRDNGGPAAAGRPSVP